MKYPNSSVFKKIATATIPMMACEQESVEAVPETNKIISTKWTGK